MDEHKNRSSQPDARTGKTWAQRGDFVEIPWQTLASPLHWGMVHAPGERVTRRLGVAAIRQGSMKTPKQSAGSGLVTRSGSPGRAPELLAPEKALEGRVIKIRGAREHNLKNIDLTFPRDKLVVFTGLSGSGKSSLAFDTIYAEGQRRYVESLSAYARQFLEMMQKPDVDQIDGLSPANRECPREPTRGACSRGFR